MNQTSMENLKKGVKFSNTNQPRKNGRIPSKLKKFIKETAISRSDIDAIFRNLIFVNSIDDLQKMIDGENKNKLPVIIALCISAFIHDMKHGSLLNVNSVLDRVLGKPTQQIDATVKTISPETRDKLQEIFNEGDVNN
jgi:hypothetical protein